MRCYFRDADRINADIDRCYQRLTWMRTHRRDRPRKGRNDRYDRNLHKLNTLHNAAYAGSFRLKTTRSNLGLRQINGETAAINTRIAILTRAIIKHIRSQQTTKRQRAKLDLQKPKRIR